MSGLLVAINRKTVGGPWERMLGDLAVLGSEARETWLDPRHGVALGRAYRHENGRPAEPAIVHHGNCTIVLDGRLSSASTEPSTEAPTDSVAVIEAYLRWGDECSAHLDGEFAFALWDHDRRRLLCACDVVGRRTLAYYWDGSTFLASTRAVTLMLDPAVPRRLDHVYLAHALCGTWAQAAGTTAFSALHRMRPGFCISVEASRFVHRRVDDLHLEPSAGAGTPGAAYDEFWSLLRASVRDCLHGETRPCVMLSGGLDSACVAIAVAKEGEEVDALSCLRESGGSIDERRAIEALLRAYPTLRWQAAAGSADPAFAESLPDAPVCDDPSLNAGPFLLSRRLAYRAIGASGHLTFLDGEGGDEIFDIAMRSGDLVSTRAWGAAATYLMRHGTPLFTLWRGYIAPHLRGPASPAEIAERRAGADPIPVWFTPAFRHSSEIQRAMDEHAKEAPTAGTFVERIPLVLENVSLVATAAAGRLFAASVGASGRSPLLNRSIVEFASRVPTSLRVHPGHTKSFLRYACEGLLPDEVRWRPKRDVVYAELLAEELASDRARALLEASRANEGFADWFDSMQVLALLDRVRDGGNVGMPAQQKLRSLLAFVGWLERVEDGYGGRLDLA